MTDKAEKAERLAGHIVSHIVNLSDSWPDPVGLVGVFPEWAAWSVTLGVDDTPIGFGATEIDAITDLAEQLEEREERKE